MSTIPVIGQFNKDPDADLDYAIDWTTFLAAAPGDSILTSTWLPPAGLTSHTTSVAGSKTITWLSGGTLGVNYPLINRIVTAQGRTEDQTVMVYIQQH